MKESEEAQAAGGYIKTIKDPDKRLYAQRYFFYLLGYDLKPPSPRPLKEEEARELQVELDKFFQSPISQYSTTVERIKFQNSFEISAYEAGQLAGMQMDTIPEALEKLNLGFSKKQVTINPWLTRQNSYDLYVVDSQGNFIRELSPGEKPEFERGIRDWLRGTRGAKTKQIWPQTTVNALQTKPKPEVRYYWLEKNLPYDTWAVVEVWPGGLVRSPFKTKEEAIEREEEIWKGVYQLKLVPSPQEKFPAQYEALEKLYPYEFIQYHDDGDLTIQELVPKPGMKWPVPFRDLIKGKQYVVTTDGEVFAHHTGDEALKRITTEYITISSKGDTTFKLGEIVSPDSFEKENERVKKLGLRPAKGWSKSKGVLKSWGNGDRPPKELEEYEPATVEAEPVPEKYRELTPFIDLPLPPGTDFLPAVVPQEGERKIDVVMKQLKDGVEGIQDSAQFRLFLTIMAKFHDYSIGNQILIMLQKPEATRVAGFMTWKDLGRWVMKGERGISILAPVMPPKPKKEEREDEEEEIVPSPVYFKVVHVFDLSQTEGKPLPEFDVPVLTGEANEELFTKVLAMAKDQGLDVSFESRPQMDPSIKGMYSAPKSIWVRPEESKAQQLKSLLHEIAHYYSEGVFRIPRRDAETIAESAAFAVGAHFGFDSGVRSFPYVALWAQEKKTLAQNLNTIRKVTDTMLHALEGTKSEMLVQVSEEPSAILKIVWGHLKCRKPKPAISIRRQHSTALYWPDENKITIREDSWRKMHPGERKLIVLHEALHACGAGHEPGFRTATDTMAMLLYKQIWGEDEDWRNFITELERRLARFLRSPSLLPDDEILLAVEYLAQTEGDPIRKFCCRFSDACAPPELLEEGKFPERIAWLRQHYKEEHPGLWGKLKIEKESAVDYLPDSAEFVAQTIMATGYREKLDEAFQEAIARVRGNGTS